jgi:hypothetical protein
MAHHRVAAEPLTRRTSRQGGLHGDRSSVERAGRGSGVGGGPGPRVWRRGWTRADAAERVVHTRQSGIHHQFWIQRRAASHLAGWAQPLLHLGSAAERFAEQSAGRLRHLRLPPSSPGDPWEPPKRLGSNINTNLTERGPCCPPTATTCSSPRTGRTWRGSRRRQPDLYKSYREDVNDDRGWQVPENLGGAVNTTIRTSARPDRGPRWQTLGTSFRAPRGRAKRHLHESIHPWFLPASDPGHRAELAIQRLSSDHSARWARIVLQLGPRLGIERHLGSPPVRASLRRGQPRRTSDLRSIRIPRSSSRPCPRTTG